MIIQKVFPVTRQISKHCMITLKKKNSLSTTALESPGTVSNQKEEEDSLWLERNEKEG